MLQCNTVFLSVLVRSEATGQEWLVEHLRCRRTTVSKAGSGGGDYWTGRQAGGEQKTQGEREKPGNLICVNNRFSIHSIVGLLNRAESERLFVRWEEKGRGGHMGRERPSWDWALMKQRPTTHISSDAGKSVVRQTDLQTRHSFTTYGRKNQLCITANWSTSVSWFFGT